MIVNHILHRKGLYSANQLHQMITVGGYIPIASPEDLDKIRNNSSEIHLAALRLGVELM